MKLLFIKTGTLLTLMVGYIFLCIIPLNAKTFNVGSDDHQYVEDKPVAVGVNGPVLEFHIVTQRGDIGSELIKIQITKVSNDKLIQEIDIDQWQYYDTAFNLVDLDFDGYKDMLVLYSAGQEEHYRAFLFNPNTSLFSLNTISLVNPTVDDKTKTVSEIDCDYGCACANYTKNFYKIFDGALITVRREIQEACNVNQETYSIFELINGNMVETQRKTLSSDR